MNYLTIITPTNVATEREKFFSSSSYEPQLEYQWDAKTIQAVITYDPTIANLAAALPTQNRATISTAAHDYFDVQFRAEDIALAHDIIANPPTPGSGTAEELAAQIRGCLQELEIDYEVVIVDKHGFQCRPQHKKQRLTISKYIDLQFATIGGVAMHEIVHIIRAVNSAHNNIRLQPRYLPTEEGLSCLIQDYYSGDGEGTLYQHAVEYLSAEFSQRAGMRDVYEFMRSCGLNEEVAWQRAIRQKYGLQNTGLPGGLSKSAMYFYHEQLLRGLSHEDLLRLFVGKIRLDQLDNYPEYSGIIPRDQMVNFLGIQK